MIRYEGMIQTYPEVYFFVVFQLISRHDIISYLYFAVPGVLSYDKVTNMHIEMLKRAWYRMRYEMMYLGT